MYYEIKTTNFIDQFYVPTRRTTVTSLPKLPTTIPYQLVALTTFDNNGNGNANRNSPTSTNINS